MVNRILLSGFAAAALALGPALAMAQDATVKKGSLEAAGSGSAATVQQAQDVSDGEFEGALIAAPFVVGGGVAAALLLGDGGSGGNNSSSTTSTSTSTATSD
ncbi:MAG: hypothetical protein QNJ30_18140 [Kiloniellales bacterium]|nr:hypothetical protein [Kiloniellales bacterium]